MIICYRVTQITHRCNIERSSSFLVSIGFANRLGWLAEPKMKIPIKGPVSSSSSCHAVVGVVIVRFFLVEAKSSQINGSNRITTLNKMQRFFFPENKRRNRWLGGLAVFVSAVCVCV